MVNCRNFLNGIPGTFGHRLVVLVVGNKAIFVFFNFAGCDFVVFINGSLKFGGIDTGLLGQFVKRCAFYNCAPIVEPSRSTQSRPLNNPLHWAPEAPKPRKKSNYEKSFDFVRSSSLLGNDGTSS